MFEDAGLIDRVLKERSIELDYVEVPSSDLTQVNLLSPGLLMIL